MAILKSTVGRTQFGSTENRPSNPPYGTTYNNYTLGIEEIYTPFGWFAKTPDSPDTPTSVVATNQGTGRAYNNGQASVAFNIPTTGGVPSSFTVTSSPGSYTATGSSSPLVITGLQSSTQYTYTVTSTNNFGTSSASSSSAGVSATTVPQAPTIGTGTGADQSVNLTFTAGATGGSAITNYKYSTDNITYTAFSPAQTSSPLTISGLTNGQSYSFYLKAVNANGDSSASSVSDPVVAGISGSYESIATVTLNGTQSSITFSNIPSTYTHLQLRYSGLSNNMGTQFMEINGDTNTANYRTHYVVGSGTARSAGDLAYRAAILGGGYSGQFSTSYPMVGIIDFIDYKNTNKYKTIRGLHGTETNNTGYKGEVSLNSGLWMSGSPITQLRFFLDGGMNFTANSKYALYGIKVA
jgi:hypothetical protein